MMEFNYYERYVRGALSEAKYYLLSNDLFWPLDLTHQLKKAPYPKFTIGNLLYFRYNTAAAAITPYHKQAITEANTSVDKIKGEWTVAWEKKADMEFSSRLRQWSYYLKELKNNIETYAPYYPVEVRVRVLLQLLVEEIKNNKEKKDKLLAIDAELHSHFNKSDFVWEADLSRAFPKKEFWYLYGHLE